jgi:hypothetical protein
MLSRVGEGITESAAEPAALGWDRRGGGLRLALVVVVATAVWGTIASLSRNPWIFVDELIYIDLARSLGEGSAPAVRDVGTHAYGFAYPLVLAPLWALAPDGASAYALAHWLNAALMSLTAVPAYLLARTVVGPRSALAVSMLAVGVPWMAYTATIFTEVALYPTFVLALWLMARALERPTGAAQLAALGAIGLAAAVKVLAVALVPAFVLAIVLLAVLARRYDDEAIGASFARFRTTGLVLGVGLLGLFGVYADAVRHVTLSGIVAGVGRHLAALAIATAVVPLASTTMVVVGGLGRGGSRADRAFAALTTSVLSSVLVAVAVFTSYSSTIDFETTGAPPVTALSERNVFVVVPLLLVGLALHIEHLLPRPRRLALGIAAACTALVVGYPWSQVVDTANPQNLSPTVWLFVSDAPWARALVAGALMATVCAFWLRVPEGQRSRLWLVPAVWFAFASLLAVILFTVASRSHTGRGAPATWIDDAVGPGATVAVVWEERQPKAFATPHEAQYLVWVSEVFNRSVGPVYALGARMPYGLPDRRVHIAADRRLVESAGGREVAADYVLTSCTLRVAAPVVAVQPEIHAALYRTAGQVRIATGRGRVC